MAKDITKELLATIKETLPETQVGLIKEALNERDALKVDVLELQEELSEVQELSNNLEKECHVHRQKVLTIEKENEQLKSKYLAMEQANEEYRRKDVERRAELAEGKLDVVRETQQLFLKNTIVREKIQHQVVDETPNMISQYTPTGNIMSQQGTNKIHRGVTDVKETGSDVEVETDERLV